MVEAKPSSFLGQTKGKSKRSLPTIWVAPSWRRKEGEDDSSKVVVVAASREEHERSCVIEKIEVRVFKACLQRPKSVIFEGLVRWFGYGVSEEEEEKVERTWRSQRVRERVRIWKMKWGCVFVYVGYGIHRGIWGRFFLFCVNWGLGRQNGW